MTEKKMDFDPKQVKTINVESNISHIHYSQSCLCCDNTRRLPTGMTYCNTPWVCDECREAIAYLKQLKAKSKRDPLEPILD